MIERDERRALALRRMLAELGCEIVDAGEAPGEMQRREAVDVVLLNAGLLFLTLFPREFLEFGRDGELMVSHTAELG